MNASQDKNDLGGGASLSNIFVVRSAGKTAFRSASPHNNQKTSRTPSPKKGRSASPKKLRQNPASRPSASTPILSGTPPPAAGNGEYPGSPPKIAQLKQQSVTNGLNWSKSSLSPIKSASESSKLDVYAPSYIPLWLTAVNESIAVPRFCSLLETVNYVDYVSSFAGRHFLQPLASVNLPTIQNENVLVAHSASPESLSPEIYGPYFWEALENEVSAEAAELRGCNLFVATLECQDLSGHLFRLRVPGLKEHSPRVDLGDVVRVRPLFPRSDAAELTKFWYSPGGGKERGLYAPGFSGLEFNAIVWGLARPQEEILLRIDGLTQLTCNIIFDVQQHRIAPIARSIFSTVDSLRAAASDQETPGWLRRMLFPELSDGVVQSTLPEGTFPAMKWVDTKLNYEQQKAANAIVSSSYGSIPYLVIGPPGTGKTKAIVEITLQLLRRSQYVARSPGGPQQTPHLLVCAPSDSAADTLASRLAGHLTPAELFRLNGWSRSFPEVPGLLLPYSYVEKDLFSLPPFETLMSYKVVVSTCRDFSMLVNAQVTNQALSHLTWNTLRVVAPDVYAAMSESPLLHWTALLIDEAAQATEPETLIPLMAIAPPGETQMQMQGLPQLIMAGDENQLGPRIFSKRGSAFSTSLFARLCSCDFYAKHPLSRQNGSKGLTSSMLPITRPAFTNFIRNYRSHPSILSVPSQLFYSDTLIPECTALSEIVQSWPGWKSPHGWPVLFVQNSGPDMVESVLSGNGTGAGALFNQGEAMTALKLVKGVLEHRLPSHEAGDEIRQDEVALMSPFQAQVQILRKIFRENGLYNVNIGPLEAFQGLESRIVVLCTTRTRRGAMEDNAARFVREDREKGLGVIGEPKRFNVAITRAKEGLIVIGDPNTLIVEHDPCWKAFVGFCARNGCLLPESTETSDDPGWVEMFAKQDGLKEGRLERALVFAADVKMREAARKEQKGFGYPDSPATRRKKRFSLKGQIPTSDEEMWKTGLQMAEEMDESTLLEDGDTHQEELESGEEEPDPWNPDRNPADRNERLTELESRTASPARADQLEAVITAPKEDEQNRVFSAASVREFDRDPKAEFERTDCATQ
jgi:helicase MOV-10